ncbi:MAG: hypothetical protein U9N59_02420, partial [Campylobacterota bacterium]|nr:hypothetical protein [Campylobacterota bacterium]
MIKYLLFVTLSLSLSLEANPYKELDSSIKLNLMINHFLNIELKKIVPPKPIKEILQDDGLSLDPVKYERYYNYIQRIKAIYESRAEEQKNIDEKYAGKVGFYNGKLKVLKRFYAKEININPLLQTSINKAFKVVYGKPKFKKLNYDKEKDILYATLTTQNIYDIDKFEDKELKLYVYKDNIDDIINNYKDIDIKVGFEYVGK